MEYEWTKSKNVSELSGDRIQIQFQALNFTITFAKETLYIKYLLQGSKIGLYILPNLLMSKNACIKLNKTS